MKNDISTYIGNRIRHLRRQKNVSNKEMAQLLGKSPSAVSKYESGTVAIDIQTLYEIAQILEVSLAELTAMPEEANSHILTPGSPFGSQRDLYLYYHDGTGKGVTNAHLKIQNQPSRHQTEVYCYLGANLSYRYDIGDFVYRGKMESFDFVTYLSLINPGNPVDRLSLCFLNPLHQSDKTWGILSSLLHNPITPYFTKVLISMEPLSDSDLSEEVLHFSKEELKWLKKENIIYVKNEK
ncbi:MAG: helix-turn-helix transcriptional regulator [Lachnospiraceae bacterium]|nr:helix-turn-helix transcriptional regulator [Lachnospiraceae bacterium]